MIYNISTTLNLGVVSFLGATWDENDTSHENKYGTQQILKKFLMNEWINQLNISCFFQAGQFDQTELSSSEKWHSLSLAPWRINIPNILYIKVLTNLECGCVSCGCCNKSLQT